jgi:hypothetical protein
MQVASRDRRILMVGDSPVASRKVAVVITPRGGEHQSFLPASAGGEPDERRTRRIDDRDRPPPARLGLLRHQTAATQVRLPKDVAQPPHEIDVTNSED